jgi:hypothetical protein
MPLRRNKPSGVYMIDAVAGEILKGKMGSYSRESAVVRRIGPCTWTFSLLLPNTLAQLPYLTLFRMKVQLVGKPVCWRQEGM